MFQAQFWIFNKKKKKNSFQIQNFWRLLTTQILTVLNCQLRNNVFIRKNVKVIFFFYVGTTKLRLLWYWRNHWKKRWIVGDVKWKFQHQRRSKSWRRLWKPRSGPICLFSSWTQLSTRWRLKAQQLPMVRLFWHLVIRCSCNKDENLFSQQFQLLNLNMFLPPLVAEAQEYSSLGMHLNTWEKFFFGLFLTV